MFERYSEAARRVVFIARLECSVLGSTELDSKHLLLGLLVQDKTLLESVPSLNAQTEVHERIRRFVFGAEELPPESQENQMLLDRVFEQPLDQAESPRSLLELMTRRPGEFSQDIPLSRSAKEALFLASGEGDRQHHDRVEPMHLLLGLILQETPTATLLKELGLSAEQVRSQLPGSRQDQ